MRHLFALAALLTCAAVHAAVKPLKVTSPNGQIQIEVTVGNGIRYTVTDGTSTLLRDCRIGLDIEGLGDTGKEAAVASKRTARLSETIDAPFYRTPRFTLRGNALTITLRSGVAVEFRAYDEGAAYRFSTRGMDGREYRIAGETAEFNFTDDHTAYLPYSTNPKKPEAMAFQATYDAKPLSQQATDNLAFLPATIDCGTAKVTLMESDLESYPGMFVRPSGTALKAWFSPVPKTYDFHPWRKQQYATSTHSFIAQCSGNRTFPWRIMAISHSDTEMPTNNLVYALASPNRIGDCSWVRPGMVAWDWWNNWGISGVDFEAGINMNTYKHYIDFASAYGLPYVILDEGWYDPKSGDMLTTIRDIDLPALTAYAKERNVRLILWTVFNVLDSQLEAACAKYADMGIAGFKVDFLDRDDQQGVEMAYRIAEACARHRLVLDYHGIYKPTGINRTYPNIVNFESVFGMEEAKWTARDAKDMPLYDVTFPFIRMQAGYVDFTPGGMRNATRSDFQPIYNNPLTMGTRCHQLAMYVVHDSPLTMLADNPTAYEQEPEYTKFVAAIPTVFDETRVPQGRMAQYIVTARRSGGDWYVGGQTNWDARDVELAFDFLPRGARYEATLYTDGANAGRTATDYRVQRLTIDASTRLTIHMASGGGFAARLRKL